MRPIIYQLFVRHFSNSVTTGIPHGSKLQNGCGSFEGINDKALESLAMMGVTHVWLTGVLRHATQTDYADAPASPSCVVKGIAGSPYAVSDYYQVDPDLGSTPAAAMDEFKELLGRVRSWGMVPMMDFIPNHVSRDYHSDSGELLGEWDDKNCFFARDNAFYYLEGREHSAPLRLPQGAFLPEAVYGRVTGNNQASWAPSAYDWYETVKLNYGLDYRGGADAAEALPGMLAEPHYVPRTWRAMDDILAFWQGLGVGGFRCDMAHMVPMQFWQWETARCRLRDSSVLLLAEGYNDHMRLCYGDVLESLLGSGFDGVYDARSYEYLRQIYEGGRWANDLDECHRSHSSMNKGGVRYLENHDEPRLASPLYWGGHGAQMSRALMLAQFTSSNGPVLFYNGQEFGERAEGPSGYGGDNGRTSIFDYTCLPRLQVWLNEGAFDESGLSPEQREHRSWIAALFCKLQEPALSQGEFYGLNWGNKGSIGFGRGQGEPESGHYAYAFLRRDAKTRTCFLVLCNLSFNEGDVQMQVSIPEDAQRWAGKQVGMHIFSSELEPREPLRLSSADLVEGGLCVDIPAGGALLLRWQMAED